MDGGGMTRGLPLGGVLWGGGVLLAASPHFAGRVSNDRPTALQTHSAKRPAFTK